MLKWGAAAAAAIVLLLIAAAVAVPRLVDTPRVRSLVADSAGFALGRRVQFSELSVTLLPLPSVKLTDLEIAEDPRFGTSPFLTVRAGRIGLRFLPLLSGRLEFTDFVLTGPQVAVLRDRTGRFNIGSLGGREAASGGKGGGGGGGRGTGSAAALPVISRIRIIDGLVRYESVDAGGGKTSYALGNLNLLIQGAGPTAPVELSGDARLADGDLRLVLTDVRLGGHGARSASEAGLSGRLALDGKDVRALATRMLGPTPELAGPVKGALNLGGTLAAPSASGQLELSQLAITDSHPSCTDPSRRTLTFQSVRLPVSIESGLLTIQPLTTALRDGQVSSAIAVELREGMTVRLRETTIRALPLGPLLVDYLCQGYAVTGPLDLTAELLARPSSFLASLTGSGRLRIGPGKVVGSQALAMLGALARVAQAALAPGERITGEPLDFESIAGTFTVDSGIARTRDFTLTSRMMKVTAAGEYGLVDGRMNLDVTATVGRTDVRARVTGSAASPSVRIDPSALLQSPDIQKGLRDLLKRLR